MIINYKVNKENYKITFCYKKESPDITNSLLKLHSDKKMLIVLDKKISNKFTKFFFKDLSKCGFEISIMWVNGSKDSKNEKLLFKIIDKLLKEKFTKRSCIISCGGGVVGDVAALASSLYLRGLIYFHIPTTMTAIVDSCIGGKTGINYKNIINSVGTYYHPTNVFISKNMIDLIPKREFLAGLPEIIKSGLINDKRIIKLLLRDKQHILNKNYTFLYRLINLTLKTKIKFFKDDVYEKSKRLNLNFGHTFAHAIEMALKKNKDDVIRHGEAVGIGMLCEIFYEEGYSKNFKFLKKLLASFNLPTDIKKFFTKKNKKKLKKNIFDFIFLDKKRISKFPRIIKINKIGSSRVAEMKNNLKIMDTIEKVILS